MAVQWRLNERAMAVADALAGRADELGCTVQQVGGARVIDAGVKAAGSIGAGLMLARLCLADLGSVALAPGCVGAVALPRVVVNVDQPVPACMASQYAGWQISVGKYFAMGSGPMRAARGREPLFDDIGLRESPDCAVGVLESGGLPDEAVVAHVAEGCGIAPGRLTLAAARTASLAGGVQVVARSVETALHKLHALAFDLSGIVGGFGDAPLPPVAADDLAAIGRTNDAVLYGARCTLYARGADDAIAEVADRLPACASADHGQPFAEIFRRYDHDFYKIDPMLFSPAAVVIQNVESGCTHVSGRVDEAVLAKSFWGR